MTRLLFWLHLSAIFVLAVGVFIGGVSYMKSLDLKSLQELRVLLVNANVANEWNSQSNFTSSDPVMVQKLVKLIPNGTLTRTNHFVYTSVDKNLWLYGNGPSAMIQFRGSELFLQLDGVNYVSSGIRPADLDRFRAAIDALHLANSPPEQVFKSRVTDQQAFHFIKRVKSPDGPTQLTPGLQVKEGSLKALQNLIPVSASTLPSRPPISKELIELGQFEADGSGPALTVSIVPEGVWVNGQEVLNIPPASIRQVYDDLERQRSAR